MLSQDQQRLLRQELANFTVNDSPLRRIALVGAYLSEYDATGLYITDQNYLTRAIKALDDLNHPVHEDFEIEVVNINKEFGGKDYLSPNFNTQADLSIFCYIPRTFAHKQNLEIDGGRATKSSPHETTRKKPWLKSALRHQSKAIVTFGGEVRFMGETGARDVIGKDFEANRLGFGSPFQKVFSAKVEPMPGDILFASGFLQRHLDYDERIEVLLHKDL